MENFVYNYGTGSAIHDPPTFINYAKPESIPASAQRPTSHPANFQRVTERTREFIPPQAPPEEEPEPAQNTAGIGAGGGRPEPPASQSRPASRASTRPSANQAPVQTKAGNGRMSASYAPDPRADPISVNEQTMLKVGDRAYPVDLAHNPQDRSGPNGGPAPVAGVGQDDDPLARQMQELRRAASGSSRQGPSPGPQQAHNPAQRPTHQQRDSVSQLSPPPGGRGGGPPNKLDYRKSAEFIVGGPPPDASRSRPASPNPIEPVMVKPPASNQPSNGVSVQNVVMDYQQSFPGERKSVSRPGSRAGSYSGQGPPQPPQGRPESMAGVGAQGRSPSPQPFRPPSRAASPMQQRPAPQPMQTGQTPSQVRRNSSSMRVPPPGAVPTPLTQANGLGHQGRQGSISVPLTGPPRSTSPNPAGIVLDPSGRVSVDVLADQYNANRQYQPPPPSAPQQAPGYHPNMQSNMGPQRSPSYPPPGQTPYNAPPQPPAQNYGPSQGYIQPAPPPPQHQPPPPQPSYGQPQYPYGQQPQQDYGRGSAPPSQPYYGNGNVGQPQQSYQPPPPQPYRDPSPARGPSPQPPGGQQTSPTGAYTDDGRPILFYGECRIAMSITLSDTFCSHRALRLPSGH